MTIVAAVDGEQIPSQTVAEAYDLARRLDEELVVMHVMPQDAFDEIKSSVTDNDRPLFLAPGLSYVDQSRGSSGGSGSRTEYSVQEGERSARNVVERVVEETLDEWNDVTLQGRVGEPVKEILDEAERRDASYVVIGGRKRTPVGKAIFGSTTQSLLLNAQIPVLTVMREQS